MENICLYIMENIEKNKRILMENIEKNIRILIEKI